MGRQRICPSCGKATYAKATCRACRKKQRARAESWNDWAKKIQQPDYKPAQQPARKCLCCGNAFKSEHRFNRVCAPCKNTDLWRASAGVDEGYAGRALQGFIVGDVT